MIAQAEVAWNLVIQREIHGEFPHGRQRLFYEQWVAQGFDAGGCLRYRGQPIRLKRERGERLVPVAIHTRGARRSTCRSTASRSIHRCSLVGAQGRVRLEFAGGTARDAIVSVPSYSTNRLPTSQNPRLR